MITYEISGEGDTIEVILKKVSISMVFGVSQLPKSAYYSIHPPYLTEKPVALLLFKRHTYYTSFCIKCVLQDFLSAS